MSEERLHLIRKEEILEQLALAKILSESELSSGRRISLIIVDNVVEYMLKSFCLEFVNKRIDKKKWKDIRGSFSNLIKCAKELSNNRIIEWDKVEKQFHSIRNMLYHEPFPLTVKTKIVDEYIRVALEILKGLFDINIEKKNFNFWKEKVRKIIIHEKIEKPIRFIRISDEIIKIEYQGHMTATDGIKLAIYGFNKEFGRPPSKDELLRCLLTSGIQIDGKTLSSRLSEMRRKGMLRKRQNILTSTAIKRLRRSFSL